MRAGKLTEQEIVAHWEARGALEGGWMYIVFFGRHFAPKCRGGLTGFNNPFNGPLTWFNGGFRHQVPS